MARWARGRGWAIGGWLIGGAAFAAVLLGLAARAPAAPAKKAIDPKAAEKFPPAEVVSERAFRIAAWAFDRGTAATYTDRWADAYPMIAFGGQSPVIAEYDVELPVAADYAISFFYAAAAARPVELYVDGRHVGQCCPAHGGTWNTSGAKWSEAVKLPLTAGKHTIKLQRDGAWPHVVTLQFESSQPLPENWKPKRPNARKLTSPPPAPVFKPYVPSDISPAALRRAIEDLQATFGDRYPTGREALQRLAKLEARLVALPADAQDPAARDARSAVQRDLAALQSEALLANPLLDFSRLLLVRRDNKGPALGLPRNWQSNSSLAKTGFDDEIMVLSPVRPDGQLTRLYKPDQSRFVGDVDLHFDADRLLFSMIGRHDRWQVWEVRTDGSGLRELTGEEPDVDSYDACYLPDGRILFTSTACFIGVPCVYGSSHVATLYRMDGDGRHIRQLCFDQEHDWCPTLLANGRVLYTRWEYTDTPHSNTRLLFHMNPDGTEQMEYLGSNSYWPNSFFYARPIPGHPTKIVSVIGGHHDHPRMGELIVFDPARGRQEAGGVVQRIPGHGQPVEPIIRDGLTSNSWPKFLHPYPLSDKYFLVACKPEATALWGIYLVDVFDNIVPVKQLEGHALLEPIPLRSTPRPPIIPDKTDPRRTDATVAIADIYQGEGLRGVPRGTVKQLRVFTYHFAYQNMGGLLGVIGMDGPWDIKRVLGTVPVHGDGSAHFRVPANTPISIQPLDGEGKALQLMRSWMTGMPGEVVQCAGCHERQNSAPPVRLPAAMRQPPADIAPWYGPPRGFSYAREVQPVIDKHCVGCHDGRPRAAGPAPCDLRGDVKITDWKSVTPGNGGRHAGKFSVGYAELHRFVRRPGIESDYHVLEPTEFHADTTHLVQMLRQGHYGVQLDREAWDRLITWIDLNAPYHGTWGEELDQPGDQRQRRRDLLKRYANVDDDPEAVPPPARAAVTPVVPPAVALQGPREVPCPGWPFDATEAQRRQAVAGPGPRRIIDLGDGLSLEMVLIPAGEFVMGSLTGAADERPLHRVKIDRPFWMSSGEITNQVYTRFDARHDSRVEDKNTYQFGIHGYPANLPEQPVVRVSWNEAQAFCRWLGEKTGQRVSLPNEAQWEWACRAGTTTPFWYGDCDADFATFANLADAKLTEFASDPYTVDKPLKNPTKYDDWIPKDARFNDGALISVAPGRYRANPWGLLDMHGNVAEWTASPYRPYPYRGDDSRDAGPQDRKVVRGGSWRDLPARSTSSFRLSYLPWQRVYNVGFRVIAELPPTVAVRGK